MTARRAAHPLPGCPQSFPPRRPLLRGCPQSCPPEASPRSFPHTQPAAHLPHPVHSSRPTHPRALIPSHQPASSVPVTPANPCPSPSRVGPGQPGNPPGRVRA
ncbi:hypothetical protein MA16_Dca021786 [Dendrobium catenatum]|uniref:Uncharacterized protein n=1 Tax=Dendrobium catenatum TaxID=906689 RepID=A0A2I0WXV1_9ASPA|nr:hypothetical protein MA16_Dca021786 [Dendrobium catenatum]